MSRVTRLNPRAAAADAVSKLGGNGKTGIYIPDGWGSSWQAKLAAAQAGSGLAKLGVRGDSISFGWYVSNPVTKSFPGLLATSLQAQYGDGGSGFDGTLRSVVAQTAFTTSTNVSTAWNTAGAMYTLTGTWTLGSGWGPASSYLVTGTAGATATRTFRGASLKIYMQASGSSSYASWTYSIDGASAVTVNDTSSGGNVIGVTTVTGLSAGTHTIVITKLASGGLPLNFHGIEGNNASGVRVDNFSKPGASGWTDYPASVGGGAASRAPGMWAGGSLNPTDLLIYALGVNDCNRTVASGVTISADIAFAATTFTMSGYLPPGTYRIDTETVRIRSVTGTAAPYTASTGATQPFSSAHTSGAAINIPEVSVSSWLWNAQEAISDLREGNPAAEILIVLPHVGNYNVLKQYHLIAQEARGVAESFGAALIDMWAIGRNSFSNWTTAGYWGNNATTTPGISGSDAVHLSDTGAQKYHDTILPLLKGQRVA